MVFNRHRLSCKLFDLGISDTEFLLFILADFDRLHGTAMICVVGIDHLDQLAAQPAFQNRRAVFP